MNCWINHVSTNGQLIKHSLDIKVSLSFQHIIKSPQGKFILLDAGTRKVLPYLQQRGIRELYMIINSHPDLDHLQGLEKVAYEMPVRYIGLPHSLLESENYDILLNTARRKNIALLGLESGQDIKVEKDWSIKVLFPEAAASEEDYNNYSLVLRVAYKGFSLLLPGDLEKQGLQTLLETRKLKPCTLTSVLEQSRSCADPDKGCLALLHYFIWVKGKNLTIQH
ncbi:MAG: MBL fold metallo-hydrolase [Syntrophomonadaceae bacterium]|nr:MBL fold metallo-hydrolase [Syntrophomonadaceae bacterium]